MPQAISPEPFVCSACDPEQARTFPKDSVLEKLPVPVTASVLPGVELPMPTLPFCKTYSELAALKPPENVEVAVVDVARMLLKNPCAAEICVVDAFAANVCSAVHVFAVVVPKDVARTLLLNESPLPTPSAPTTPVALVERIEL